MKPILIGIVLISGCRLFGPDDPTPANDVSAPDADMRTVADADGGQDAAFDVGRDATQDATLDLVADAKSDATLDTGSDAPDASVCPLDAFEPIAHWTFDIVSPNGDYENTGVDPTVPSAFAIGAPTVISTLSARGNAVQFDGVDDGLVIGHSAAFELREGTVSIWVNATTYAGASDFRGIISKDHTGNGTGGHFGLLAQISGAVNFRTQTTLDSNNLLSQLLVVNRWTHLAVTFGLTGKVLYVDGVPAANDPTATGSWYDPLQNVTNTEPIGIGFSTSSSSPGAYTPTIGYMPISVDEAMIFDRVLSATEVAELRTAVLTECLPF